MTNKYLMLMQLFILTLIGQSIIQSAARIQMTEEETCDLDLDLIYTALLGNKDKVKKLINAGVNVNARDQYGRTALMLAGGKANDVIGIIENTALIPPTNKGHKDIAKLLIKHKANVNAVDVFGNTALMYAANNGYKELVELLITHGAHVNAADIDGVMALTKAIRKGDIKIVEMLLKAGTNVNASNKYDYTALMYAAKKGYKEIVELLITHGAHVNAVDIDGDTALTNAVRKGDKKIVEMLLKAGTNIENEDIIRAKAIYIARNDNKQEIVQLLEYEPTRREDVVNKWIKEKLSPKINEATSGRLFLDVAHLTAQYTIEYSDLPLTYRLAEDKIKSTKCCVIS